MISLLKVAFNKYSKGDSESCNGSEFQPQDNEVDLIAKQQADRQEITDPRLNKTEDEKGCFYKTGFITETGENYVMIDDDYFCEAKNIIPTDLKIGDNVYYRAYRKSQDDDLKIRKILDKIETTWETEERPRIMNSQQRNSKRIDQTTEKKAVSTKLVIGKITARKGREISVEDQTCNKISVNLNNIKSEFVPFVGDWIKLECLHEINENIANLEGEILKVEEMKPLRSQQKIGKVTEYKTKSEFGIIDEIIVFAKSVCSFGYEPRPGDKVVVYCIESDQGVDKKWRAVQVVPIEYVFHKYETSTLQFKPEMTTDELNELTRDKGNIMITNNIKVHLAVEAVKIIEITVKNTGNYKQTLCKCGFLSKKSQSQLTLLNSLDNKPHQTTQEPQYLKPSDSITYRFECRGCFVGVSEELVVFTFRGFKIGRLIEITVDNVQQSEKVDSAESSDTCTSNGNYQSVKPRVHDDEMYIKGVKPHKPARFIKQRPKTWKIPDILWEIMEEKRQKNKWDSAVTMALANKVPCLRQYLTVDNYKQRFEYLLYLEEIEQIYNMRQFDMASAIMHQNGEFLTLNVPGLAEKRPSLIIGDRVLVSFNWDKSCAQKCYEGYIHKIRNSDVFLKFHESFHKDYRGEECQISFKGSTTVLQRCHTAISMAMDRLGANFIFPKRFVEKEPQFNFIEAEDDDADSDEDDDTSDVENDEDRKRKKIQQIYVNFSLSREEQEQQAKNIWSNKRLTWFNKRLNDYQKEAVRNILKGVARPLPYVIFGPPGTGKTVTACEATLQILSTMNGSRILVCTPSNSSANLIAERLLKSKRLKPGNLFRLVGHHYLESDQIPDTLIPYCATADIAEEGTRTDVNLRDVRGYQKNVTWSVLRQSRIIVGTCTAVGILHNMGCEPGHFTHVVIDEAGQATEPEIMIPLILAESSSQIILAGDPKQLGPVNQSIYAKYYGLNDSFLVRLLQHFPYQRDPVGFDTGYNPRLVTKLLRNYRSLPDLLELANKLFYENELKSEIHETDSEEAELLNSLKDMLPRRLGDPWPIVFHAVDGNNMQDPDSPSWYNIEEANQVCDYLQKLYERGLLRNDIGIITPYSKQVYKIKNMIADLNMDIPKVGSVEEFQGQERKVIILSIVRTTEDKVKNDKRHALGFFHTPERVNVAITRARSLLIIIGNPNLLKKDHSWWSVLEHCRKRNAYVID